MFTLRWGAVVWLVVCGCGFEAATPPELVISCGADADCPRAMRCQDPVGRCVALDRYDDAAPVLSRSALTLAPRLGNRLSQPTAFGPRSEARVTLLVSEPLQAPPSLWAEVDGARDDRVACRLVESAPPAFDFVCVVAMGGADGTLSWKTSLVDVAGREGLAVLPMTTALDVTSPAPVRVDDGGVMLHESPWGDVTTGGLPATELRATPAATTAVFVALRRGVADLGTVAVAADGAFGPVALPMSSDPNPLEVLALDGAGNQSSWVAVTALRWVASFGGKVPNELFPNPHRLQVLRALRPGLDGLPVVERGAEDGLAAEGGAAVGVGGAALWERSDFAEPQGRSLLPALAYDELRSRLVRFGGADQLADGGVAYSDTVWEWDGSQWVLRVPTDPEGDGHPAPRYLATATWVSQLRGVVVTGGANEFVLTDSWVWNGLSWRRLPDTPLLRTSALTYVDPSTREYVVTGGLGVDGGLVDRTLALTSAGWVTRPTPPFGLRARAAVCVDSSTSSVFVVGSGAGAWQGTDAGWAPLPTGVTDREFAGCAFDTSRRTLVVFGGLRDGGIVETLEELVDGGWVDASARSSESPGPRALHALGYDVERNTLVMVGGTTSLGPSERETTWAFGARGWRRAYESTRGPDVMLTDFVWDAPSEALRALSFTPSRGVEDSWLTRAGWRHQPTLPIAGPQFVLTPSSAGGLRLVTGTGTAVQVWRDGPGGWATPVTTSEATERLEGAAANGRGFDLFVLRAGTLHVLHFDERDALTSQHQLGPVSYSKIASGPVHLDSAASMSARLLGFDGGVEVPLGTLPGFIAPLSFTYDSHRNSWLMPLAVFGNGRPADGVWEFRDRFSPIDVTTLAENATPTASFPVTGHEPLTGLTVVTSAFAPSSTWWLSIAQERPAAFLRFSLTALPRCSVTRGRLVVTTGASGEGAEGVEVAVRTGGTWSEPLASSSASANRVARLVVTLERPTLGPEVSFRLVPRGTNGAGFAQLTIDEAHFEVDCVR